MKLGRLRPSFFIKRRYTRNEIIDEAFGITDYALHIAQMCAKGDSEGVKKLENAGEILGISPYVNGVSAEESTNFITELREQLRIIQPSSLALNPLLDTLDNYHKGIKE